MARYALFCLATLLAVSSAYGSRQLLQAQPASCPIFKCKTTTGNTDCFLKKLPGLSTRVWTCKECASGYVRSRDGRACVCPPGKYESNAGACVDCPIGSYCKGGSKVLVETTATLVSAAGAPLRGPVAACDTAQVGTGINAGSIQLDVAGLTSPLGARKITQCVAKPGFKLANPGNEGSQTSSLCDANSYNPGGNRALRCQTCPTDLVTFDNGATAAVAIGKTRAQKADCLVQPGWYWNSRSSKPVKQCPMGTYRASGHIKAFADSRCDACPDGMSTDNTGRTALVDCNMIKAGYEVVAFDANGVVTTTKECEFGFYSLLRAKAGTTLVYVDSDSTADDPAFSRNANAAINICVYCGEGQTTYFMGSDASTDCKANAITEDTALTCAADGANYGWEFVDKTDKPSQTFKVDATGTLKSIDVFMWGKEGDGSAAGADVTYTLKLSGGDLGTDVYVTAAVNVPGLPSTCTAIGEVEEISDCAGGWISFDFATTSVSGAPAAATAIALTKQFADAYKWELTCTAANGDNCGHYGYCDNGAAYADGTAAAGATAMPWDASFVVNMVQEFPQLKKAGV